jgi:hypothetical protein
MSPRIATQPELDPLKVYGARLDAIRAELCRLKRRYSWLSLWRRLLIGALALLALLAEGEGFVAKLFLVGGPALLIDYLIKRRTRIVRSIWAADSSAQLYLHRLACVAGNWAGTGETGARYLQRDHPAAADLDLFGVGSLFERLSTPSMRAGQDTLAVWLLVPAAAPEVRERNAAVGELRGRLDLRERVFYLAGQVAESEGLAQISEWGCFEPVLASRWWRLWAVLGFGLTAAAVSGWLFLGTGAVPVLVCLGLQAAFAAALNRWAAADLGVIEDRPYDLASLGRLFACLEQETFVSQRLKRLRAELVEGPASRRTSRLHQLHRWAPLARLLLCRPQAAVVLNGWRQSSGPRFGRWLGALAEIESLCALAAYSFECPEDPFPEVLDGGTVFEARGLGHPFLPKDRCVPNDLELGSATGLLIVSGSNMAGKSTLLRAVGVNTVLALAGGPVRAQHLRLSPLAVGATLRIHDSLEAGRSRFQAEVLRVRRLLDMARESPLLFLLDELFQGTNSADRRLGAEAVLRQLLAARAVGLVTTHDLALTEITDGLGGRAANVHFEDCFVDGKLAFDYQMRPGVVRHTNGLALMRAVGIQV